MPEYRPFKQKKSLKNIFKSVFIMRKYALFSGRAAFLNVSTLAFSNICPSILSNRVKFFEGTNQRLGF